MNYYELMIRRSRSVEPPAPAIPTDYVLYAPLHDDFTAEVGTYAGKGDNWSIDTTECAAYNSFFVDSSGNYAIKYNPSQNTIYGSNPRTMSIWYKPEVSNVELNTIGYGSTGNLNCILGSIFDRTKIWVEWANSWATIETGVTLDTNEWHLMTIAYGGANTTIKAYVDGVFVGETSSTLTYNTSQTNVYVGTRTYDGRPFRGWLCEARVYDRELTSTEIANLYAYGNGIDVTSVRFNGGSTTFVNGNASSLTLQASPSGCTFTASSTLPAGVTLSSDGTLAYDGITPLTQDTTLTIPVTASKTGLESATANVTVTLKSENTIPTDYVLYAPLSSYAQTAETGQALTYTNADASNFTTYQGISCFDCTTATRRVLTGTINMNLNAEYTMSVWCAVTTLTNFPRGMCFGNDTSRKSLTTPDFWMGTWDFCVGGYDTDVRTGHYGEANRWYNCVQTFDHGICKLYLDGVLIYTSSSLNITVDNAIVSFGAPTTYTNTNYLRGYVAAGRLYNRVLTAYEIQALANEFVVPEGSDSGSESQSESGSESGSGSESHSESQSESQSQSGGIPTDYILYAPLKTKYVPEVGKLIGKDINWSLGTAPDGTSAIGNTSTSNISWSMMFEVATSVTGTNPITLSAWFYDIDGTNNCGLMGLGTKSYDNILSPEYFNSTKVGFPWGENWAGSEFGNGNTLRPSANTWHHIAITFDTEYVRWYTDGVLVGTSADASMLSIGSSDIYLGSRLNDYRPFRGYIRNYLVYDRALTSYEISAIYNEGID